MKLDGWDTCSLVSMNLVNAALAKAGKDTIRTFAYKEKGLTIEGSFGPWALAPGGSLRLVEVEMPVTSGMIREHGAGQVDISGVSVVAQMKLGLIDASDANKRNLVFDTTLGDGAGGQPIRVTDITDPSGLLDRFDLEMIKEALTACLSEHAADASYVFASVDARGTAATGGLACPANDWAFVDPGDGRGYLAILGSLDPNRADGPIRIAPELMSPAAEAYFAVSQKLFNLRALQPILQNTFRPRVPFKVKGNGVASTKAVKLGRKKISFFTVEPILTGVSVTPVKNALKVHAVAYADLPLSTRLDVTVDITMPFHHDPKTGAMAFRPGKPVVNHRVSGSGIVGNTLGLVVQLIVKLVSGPISASIGQIANGMQAVANPAKKPVVWNGVRDFHAAKARWDNGLWIADTRPVEQAAPQEEKIHEPA